MASKSKIEKRRQEERKKLGCSLYKYFRMVFFLFVILFVSLSVVYFLNHSRTPVEEVDLAQNRFQSELALLATDNIISDKYPVALKQRLQRLISLNQAGKIGFDINANRNSGAQYSIMACACDTPEPPKIVIFAPWFNNFAEKQKSDAFRTLFAIILYHESIHLERWPISGTPTFEEDLDEEVKAYSKTSLDIVRPLRLSGAWITYDFLGIDDVLKNCNDNPRCPEFRQKIKKYSRPPIRATPTQKKE